jgi:hypothetical protein
MSGLGKAYLMFLNLRFLVQILLSWFSRPAGDRGVREKTESGGIHRAGRDQPIAWTVPMDLQPDPLDGTRRHSILWPRLTGDFSMR